VTNEGGIGNCGKGEKETGQILAEYKKEPKKRGTACQLCQSRSALGEKAVWGNLKRKKEEKGGMRGKKCNKEKID